MKRILLVIFLILPPMTVVQATPSPGEECTAIPQSITARESGCRNIPNAQGSGCDGYYQICKGTWNNYQGYPDALSAPKHVQDAKAAELWNGGRGCAHWEQTGGCRARANNTYPPATKAVPRKAPIRLAG